MTVSNTETNRSRSLTIKVLLGLVVAGCFLPQPAAAQPLVQAGQTDTLVQCVNKYASQGVDKVAANCVPQLGQCYYTNTMSEESAQPACTRKGVRLPRIILSCAIPGNNGVERFRPSWTLCTTGGVIDHIETGEDQTIIRDEDHPMANSDLKATSNLNTRPPVGLDTNANPLCTDCHDHLGTASTTVAGLKANLFRPIPPNEVPGVILSTNDPFVLGPNVATPLSTICSEIDHGNFVGKKEASALCHAFADNNLAGEN